MYRKHFNHRRMKHNVFLIIVGISLSFYYSCDMGTRHNKLTKSEVEDG